MNTVYLIPPGTSVDVSENGAEFKAAILNSPAQLDGPMELTDTHAIFANGQLQIRVPCADVMMSRYDGLGGGTNQFGV